MSQSPAYDGQDRRRGERRSKDRPGRDRRALTVEGVTVNVSSMDDAVSSVVEAAQRRDGFCLYTLNLDHVVQLRARSDFREAYRRASFVTADGFPIVMLGRLAGANVSRTTGADLVGPVCDEAARAGLSVFLLGSDDVTLTRCRELLTQRFNLRVAGAYAPGRNFDPHSVEADDAIERIRASGARLCFVALGAPKQELFAARCLDLLPETGFLCVGAALDFIAGAQLRAPSFAQKNGLEWAWRMMRNPRRLGLRYARCLAEMPRLVIRTLPQIVQTRMGNT